MKTNLTSRLVLVLCVAAALVVGCGGDDPTPASCDSSVSSYEAAINAYIADPTNKSKCQAFKSAAASLLDCPHLTVGQRKEYEDAVDGITCD